MCMASSIATNAKKASLPLARIRALKIGFFKNEMLGALPLEDRLLFAGLWVLADRDGRLEDRPPRIKAELFPYDDVKIETCLHRLTTVVPPFIHRYVTVQGKFIQIVNWHKHQRPHHTEPISLIPAPLDNGETTVSTPLEHGENPLGNGEWGMGLGNGNGEGASTATAALATTTPHGRTTNLVNGSDLRRHGSHAWCDHVRSLCITPALHQEFQQRGMKSDAELRAWYPTVIGALGQMPVGDDLFDFWRAAFGHWVGTVAVKPANRRMTRNEEMMAAAQRTIARAEGRIK